MAKIDNSNPLTKRYPPNCRFTIGAFKDQIEVPIRIDEFGESIVDKESYRLSLTSKRGAIGHGSSFTGAYMFQDGKYDSQKDFSFAIRKDLSIVELDSYIEKLEKEQKYADANLSAQIENEIALANEKRKSLKET